MSTAIERVNAFLQQKRLATQAAKARQDVKVMLCLDVARMDTQELFAKLKQCTVEEYGRNGRTLRLNPYHVYKKFFSDRYRAILNPDSDRLPEQQFTAAFIAAVKFGIGDTLQLASQELKQAWLEIIGEDEEFGTKQVTLQKRILPTDYAMKSFLLSRYAPQETAEETDDKAALNEILKKKEQPEAPKKRGRRKAKPLNKAEA